MKNKAPLALMEQLIMLLVFALAAALCLQIFVFSGQVSEYCRMRSHGVTVAQNAAEAMKLTGGDLEQCAGQYGGTWDDTHWNLGFNDDWLRVSPEEGEYLLQVTLLEDGVPLLGTAEVTVREAEGDGEEFIRFRVSWQEETHG